MAILDPSQRRAEVLQDARLLDDLGDSEATSFGDFRSEEHTSELQSRGQIVCRLLLEKKNCGRNETLYAECVSPLARHTAAGQRRHQHTERRPPESPLRLRQRLQAAGPESP